MNKLLAWMVCILTIPFWLPGWMIASLCIGLEETWLAMLKGVDILEAITSWSTETIQGKTKLPLRQYVEERL